MIIYIEKICHMECGGQKRAKEVLRIIWMAPKDQNPIL